MSEYIDLKKKPISKVDYWILGYVIILIGVGFSILFSSSYYIGENSTYFLRKQFLYFLLGVGVFIIVSHGKRFSIPFSGKHPLRYWPSILVGGVG